MSVEQAEAFMNRVESDEAFAAELDSMKDDQAAVKAAVVAAGFDATTDEIRDAFVNRFGDQLTEEQLAAVAGGLYNPGTDRALTTFEIGIFSYVGVTVGLTVAAAAA